MKAFKSGVVLAVLLAICVTAPAAFANKLLYQAGIKVGSAGVGSAVIAVSSTGAPEYIVRTFAAGSNTVDQVYLAPTGGTSWSIPLCTNGGPAEDDCVYGAGGELDITGAITPSMLIAAGVTGGQFNTTLRGGALGVFVAFNGSVGSGVFVRII